MDGVNRYSVVSNLFSFTDLELWRALLRYSEEIEDGAEWAEVRLDNEVIDRYTKAKETQ